MKKKQAAGMTILELMVVVSISGILITLALASWNYLNKHIWHQESKGDIRNETARIANEISLKLRKTPGVLQFTSNSVTLIDSNSNDTLEYAFDGESITKNGKPMPFNVLRGSITSFYISDQTAGNFEYLLLETFITSQDARGNRDTVHFIVNAKRADASWEELF